MLYDIDLKIINSLAMECRLPHRYIAPNVDVFFPIFLFLPLFLVLMLILDSSFGLINGYYASLSLPYDSSSEKDLSLAVESRLGDCLSFLIPLYS